jgi:hypothetical protein
VFASDWGNGLTVDAFVLELPAYQPLRLTASSDATLYRSGSTLRVSLGAENAGAPGAVELLVLFLLPDGDQVVMLTPGGFRAGRLSELAGLVALGGVSLETPFEWADADFLDLPWSPGSTPGSYALLFVAISPGSLADGKVEPLDVRALASRSFVFLP